MPPKMKKHMPNEKIINNRNNFMNEIDTEVKTSVSINILPLITTSIIVLGALSGLAAFIVGLVGQPSGKKVILPNEARRESVIVLSTDSNRELYFARKKVEELGGTIKNVIPPSTIIGSLNQSAANELKGFAEIQTVTSNEISQEQIASYNPPALTGLKL